MQTWNYVPVRKRPEIQSLYCCPNHRNVLLTRVGWEVILYVDGEIVQQTKGREKESYPFYRPYFM